MIQYTYEIFIYQWTVCGDEKTIVPTKLHSPLEENKLPVEVNKEQLPDNTVRPFQPKPGKYFPEGPSTFWVGLSVDGYIYCFINVMSVFFRDLHISGYASGRPGCIRIYINVRLMFCVGLALVRVRDRRVVSESMLVFLHSI